MPDALQGISGFIALLAMGFLVAIAAFPMRRAGIRTRLLILACCLPLLLGLPLLARDAPLALRIIITLQCTILLVKLYDLHCDTQHWHGRSFRDWLIYLANPYVLVHRRHVHDKKRLCQRDLRLVLRGLVEVTAGALLLMWALHADLGRHSFWLDHFVKLMASYLLVIDGMFVLITGVYRLLGGRMIDQSLHPIIARSPANFWRRYNRDAGRYFHENVFRPLRRRLPAPAAVFITFMVNGLIHEYLASVLIGRITGYQLAFFALHGTAVAITFRWQLRGSLAVMSWACTLLFLVVTSVLFFTNVDQLHPGWFYPNGSILP